MKTLIASLCICFLLVASLVIVNANDILTVEADILGPAPAVLSVEVPDFVYLGNVSKGEETDKVKIYMNNTGNVPILVTPELVNSDEIFDNLYFARRTTDSYEQIGEWSMNLTAPTTGGIESDYFYMKLDLRNYNKNITQDYIGKQADVKFRVAQLQ